MTNAISRKLIVFGIVLPLAVYVGYLMANPDFGSIGMVGLLFCVLLIPIFLRWHHPFLVLAWNMPIIIYFLPGSPPLWMLAAIGSLGVTLLGSILDKDQKLIHVPSVFWWLMAMGAVVLFTMKMNGGMGLRSFGGNSYGGKKYFFLLLSILGFVALCSRRIPPAKAYLYTGLFLLPMLVTVLSNLIYLAGPSFWFLYRLFPVDWAIGQAMEDFGNVIGSTKFGRLSGLSVGGIGLFSFMLARFGIRGLMVASKPWRLALFAVIVIVSMLGGFRSVVVQFALLFALQYLLEGLLRTRLTVFLLLLATAGMICLVPFAQKLPLSIQRSLAVLPIEIHPAARADAQGSSEWRLQMWRVLLPEIPNYLWVGKGFTASATDYYFAVESNRRGLAADYEISMVAGDYHSGPLSLIIPFGIWGVIAFIGFAWASLRVLYLNYKNGPPELKLINTFLLAAFLARLIFFCFVFGAISLDLTLLAGLVALGISLNGGVVRSPAQALAPAPMPAAGTAERERPRFGAPLRPYGFGRR